MRPALTHLIAIAAIIPCPLFAQLSQFAPVDPPGTFGGFETLFAVADFDGDGLLDVWSGTRLFLGVSAAVGPRIVEAADGQVPTLSGHPRSAATADLDADGDIDIVLGMDGPNAVLINDGNGAFTEQGTARLPTSTAETRGVALFDADADGDFDLICANDRINSPGERNRLFLNDGSGVFQEAPLGALPVIVDRTASVATGDLDGDGDPDIVFGQVFGPSTVLLNDGLAGFAAVPGAVFTSAFAPARRIALGDIDGDGDLDAVTEQVSLGAAYIGVYRNDGAAGFQEYGVSFLEPRSLSETGTVLVDLDGDSDLDLWSASIRLNDGTGNFAVLTDSRVGPGAVADLDRDGDPDLVSVAGVFENDGSGRPLARSLPIEAQPSPGFEELPDRNGDGIPDIRWRGDRLAAPVAYPQQLSLAAYGSESTDAAAAREFFSFSAYLGDVVFWETEPDGVLASRPMGTGLPRVSFSPLAPQLPVVAAGDVDGDGDRDFVAGTVNPGRFPGWYSCTGPRDFVYYRNDGGTLTRLDHALPPLDVSVRRMEFGDVDTDGDLDLVLAVGAGLCAQPDRLLINDGTGNFSDQSTQRLPQLDLDTLGVTFGDVDGDGDQDLVLSFSPATSPAREWLNDGTGHFVDAGPGRLPDDAAGDPEFALVDVDQDGDVDYVGRIVALNDGSGVFVDATMAIAGTDALFARPVDADLDGDLDLVIGGATGFVNLRRHLRPLGLPERGRPWTLALSCRPGAAVAIPWISFAQADLPTPFGQLGFDPLDSTVLPPVAVTGDAHVTIPVPNSMDVVGIRYWTQALFVHLDGSGATRLSNVTHGEVVDLWVR